MIHRIGVNLRKLILGSNHGKRISPHHRFVKLNHVPWRAWQFCSCSQVPGSLGLAQEVRVGVAGAVLSGHALNDDCDALATANARRPNAVFPTSAP